MVGSNTIRTKLGDTATAIPSIGLQLSAGTIVSILSSSSVYIYYRYLLGTVTVRVQQYCFLSSLSGSSCSINVLYALASSLVFFKVSN